MWVELSLRNTTEGPLELCLAPGQIFEHPHWVHRQDLVVRRECRIVLGPGEGRVERVGVFGMHSCCPAPSPQGDVVNLTEFFLPDRLRMVLCTQPTLWKHFDAGLKEKAVAAAKAKKKKAPAKGTTSTKGSKGGATKKKQATGAR